MMPDHRGLSHVFGIPRAKVEILVTATSEGDPVLAIGGVVPLRRPDQAHPQALGGVDEVFGNAVRAA